MFNATEEYYKYGEMPLEIYHINYEESKKSYIGFYVFTYLSVLVQNQRIMKLIIDSWKNIQTITDLL